MSRSHEATRTWRASSSAAGGSAGSSRGTLGSTGRTWMEPKGRPRRGTSSTFTGPDAAFLAGATSIQIPRFSDACSPERRNRSMPPFFVGGVGVRQTLTAGMERLRGILLPVIQELFHPRGIFLRNDAPSRLLEGLPLEKACLGNLFDPVVAIEEADPRFQVDIAP